MAKNAKSSWVGKTSAPQFKTYQTAGQLQPVAAPTPPAAVTPTTPVTPVTPTVPVTPMPIYTPPADQPFTGIPGFSLGGGLASGVIGNDLGNGNLQGDTAVAGDDANAGRIALAHAIMNQSAPQPFVRGPSIGVPNASTLRNGVGGLGSIRRNN